MGSRISQIGIYLPEKTVKNEDLSAQFPEWSAEKIGEKIGVSARHVAAENETALDMAIKASEKILTPELKEKINFILLCTQSPDYFLPTSACIMQDKLGLRKNIGALDYNLGCSGFIYGLALSKSLISSGIAEHILLVTSETYSKHIHINDKSDRSIFGDAAAAIIIEKSVQEQIGEFVLGTDGSGYENLIVRTGGMRNKTGSEFDRTLEEEEFIRQNYLYMNGPEIFNFTLKNIPPLISETLKLNSLNLEAIDYVIFHQANKYILEYLRKKLKIPEEKFFIEMENTGNTVSATIPIALDSAMRSCKIKKGDKVLLTGFGVGYSWGATIIEV